MTPKSLLIVSMLVVSPVAVAYAQDEQSDGGRERVGPAVGTAVARPAPQPAAPAQPAPAPPRAERPVAAAAASAPASADDQGARQRSGGRDRGDNPAVGRAVPRGTGPDPGPAPGGQSRNDGRVVPRSRGGNIYVAPPRYNYYYYPRRYYPYGYGAFGLGYFYYDPYTWYPPSYYSGAYGGGYYDPYFDTGELRIDVSPSYADVFVDGYFAGRVDDYDGIFQALKLEGGPHHLQIVAQGFTPLDFDVRIEPGRKITYRGALVPYRP